MSKPTLKKQVEELTNRVLILEKMVAHILYTEPRDDEDDEDYENPYPDPNEPFQFDGMVDDAWKIVSDVGKASTSFLQRRMSIGYNRAAQIMDELEKQGVIAPADPNFIKPREILKKYPSQGKT